MKTGERRIAQAWLNSLTEGVVELCRDWKERSLPPLLVGEDRQSFTSLRLLPPEAYGSDGGYFLDGQGKMVFVFDPTAHDQKELENDFVYLAGDFNEWAGGGTEKWKMSRETVNGRDVYVWRDGAEGFFTSPPQRFKFVSGSGHWFEVPPDAPNAVVDEGGHRNREINPARTGRHRFAFTTKAPVDLVKSTPVFWDGTDESVMLRAGYFFFDLKSDLPLGAIVEGKSTVFRLFAPRARRVKVFIQEKLGDAESTQSFAMARNAEGVWEARVDANLHLWYYWYTLDGPHDAFGAFNRSTKILDPYALAVVDRTGPGIILEPGFFPRPKPFKAPAWQDLIVAEAHVRDLVALAPIKLKPEERLGFAGLTKWVESAGFYLKKLGVNAVELQPIQEFDNRTPEEYHWGYMPVNYFAPESSYAQQPEKASQVREFHELVEAFHRRGMAVILDVVYNHVGEPAHLLLIDKLYYFEENSEGQLSNWSGCGNDLRCRSAMTKRLIIDSLRHFIEVYGVDGFRFDLAELIGVDVLQEIEIALKAVKPDVILIAEPWSFRGHVAGALRTTGYASWNDGYRNFMRDYVRAGGSREGIEYFLKGSPWYYAFWPAQTVNYTESHDDRTWIDMITENPDFDGFQPTLNDCRRTHLMVALLMMSFGIPMLSAGQDFLRSKHGVNNTYQRGDLNALDYKRIFHFPGTHAYFAGWIRFRLSEYGRLLRLYTRPPDEYFRFFFAQDSTALACVYNVAGTHGPTKLLFAINPHPQDVFISIGEMAALNWRQVADHERFFTPDSLEPPLQVEESLYVPGLGCGLWVAE